MPHQYFWYHTTLEASGHIEEGIQNLVLKLSLGLFATWIFLFFIIIMGLNISMLVSHPDLWPCYLFVFLKIPRFPAPTPFTCFLLTALLQSP